jgi:hypothetical protein
MRRVQINTYSQSNLALAVSPFSQPIPNNRNYRNKTENGLTIFIDRWSKLVGWAMPTDHISPKQKDFKLFDSIIYSTLRGRVISTLIDINHTKTFILINQKWSVGNAHPTAFLTLDLKITIHQPKFDSVSLDLS